MSHDFDKELIGLLSQNKELLGKSLGEIDSDHFAEPYNRVYKLLKTFYQKHQKLPSPDLLETQLFKQKDQLFSKDNNAEEIILGIRTAGTLSDPNNYDFLVDEAKKRKAAQIVQKMIPKAVDLIKEGRQLDAAEVFVSAGNAIKTVLNQEQIKHTSNHDHVDTLLERYAKTKESPELAWGFKSGFERLDEATHGLCRGEMFLVAARPGCGKSMFLLSAAINMFNSGVNILYVSIEMAEEQMWERASACYTGIEINKIKEGLMTEEEETAYRQALSNMKSSKNRFEIIDAPNVTVPTIASEIEKMIDEHSPDVVFVDYLGIIKPTVKGLADNLAQASVVEELRGLARQKNIGIFTAAQLNRDPNKGKGKVKSTERIARSDVLATTADLILAIENDGDTEEALGKLSDRIKIISLKNRKGPHPFAFDVRKDFSRGRFLDWNLAKWSNIEF